MRGSNRPVLRAIAAGLFSLQFASATLADEPAFVGRNQAQMTFGGTEFPSDEYRTCRVNAAADLKKIFFCTKKEWIRATNEVLARSRRLSSKLSTLKESAQYSEYISDGILPRYILAESRDKFRDFQSYAQDALSIEDESLLQKFELQEQYYKDDGSFEWEVFDYSEDAIVAFLNQLQSIEVKAREYSASYSKLNSLVTRMGLPRKVFVNFSPSPTKEYSLTRKFIQGKATLQLDIGERLSGVGEYLITGLSLGVSADNPTPLRAVLMTNIKAGKHLGEQISIDVIPNRVGGTLSRYTNKSWNDLRYKYLDVSFDPVDERFVRTLNYSQWNGKLIIALDFSALSHNGGVGITKDDVRLHRIVVEVRYLPLKDK